MSEQNMTRRSAVKLGGATLAAVGLSAGGAGASAPPPGADYPDFRGKTALFYTRAGQRSQLLTDPVFATLAGRLFLTGTVPALGFWTDSVSAAVAWDLVDSYLVFDSVEDYEARWKAHKSEKEAKAARGAATGQSRN